MAISFGKAEGFIFLASAKQNGLPICGHCSKHLGKIISSLSQPLDVI